MKKLLKLLREYDGISLNPGWDVMGGWLSYNRQGKTYSELFLISKTYGFIERLCENDKIDFNKCEYGEIIYKDGMQAELESYEHILMELAIQEEPIVYLCKILR